MKKKIVALILLVCCVASGWLLLDADPPADKNITNVAQIDSLILHELYNFGVSPLEVEQFTTTIDSTFSRKTFVATVTPGFPETRLHIALKQLMAPYQIDLPAQIIFPEKDLKIHFSFKNTVFRTLLIDVEEADKEIAQAVQ